MNLNYTYNIVRECLIENKRVLYDACGTDSLEDCKKYYEPKYEYIGSGYTYYINGVENISEILHHFFILHLSK